VQNEITRGHLVFIPLADAGLGLRRLSLIARPKGEASEAALALSASLTSTMEGLKS